jgi:hypothetical protein
MTGHLCTVAEERIDPLEALGIIPDRPLAHWGWGEIPDQYGRRSETDDGEARCRLPRSAPTFRRCARGGDRDDRAWCRFIPAHHGPWPCRGAVRPVCERCLLNQARATGGRDAGRGRAPDQSG